MGSKSFIVVSALVVMLVTGAVGVYAYDSSRSDLIARGITVGGVKVGGLRADDARARLQSRLLEPLNRPVVARWHGHRYRLTPERARVGVNIDRSVEQALERSRDGGILSRTVRGLTGGRLNTEVPVDITYDHSAVARLVKRVESALERPAVDATVDFSGGQVSPQPSREGREVLTRSLRREVARRLVSHTGDRMVQIRTRTVQPKVTTADLEDKYPSIVVVNRGAFTLRLFKDLKEARSYRIAVGMAGLETPPGLYSIQDKQINPAWHVPDSDWAGDLAGTVIPPGDPGNPIKARWMGIYNGAGIHGTDAIGSLGTAASHGCIRMAIPDVEALFEEVDVGTPVYIL